MKVVFIFFFFLLLLNIQASTNPTLRKANLLNSFQNFTIENLRSIESPNIKSYLSFLEKGVSSNIKLDSFAAIAKEYLAAQQEAKQLNESAVSHIMVISPFLFFSIYFRVLEKIL